MAYKKNYQNTTQISESHCGAAVLQMLLESLGVITDQVTITKNAGAEQTVEKVGIPPRKLAQAVKNIAKDLLFWFKNDATPQDIVFVLNHNHPVGVDWQGLFYNDENDEDPERLLVGDYGHYSIVSEIDIQNNKIVISDPYPDFARQDRVIPLDKFISRWFDYEVDPAATNPMQLGPKHTKTIFVVTQKENEFPQKIGMKTI